MPDPACSGRRYAPRLKRQVVRRLVEQPDALVKQHGIRGLEFDWYACDGVGHVALLSSAGSAIVPQSILDAVSQRDLLDDHFAITSRIRSEWEQFAEMGLFVYDCGSPHAAVHRRLALPSKPLLRRDLPESPGRAAGIFVFSTLRFADTDAIDGGLVVSR